MGYYRKNWMGKMEYIPDQPNNTETIDIVDGVPVTTSNKTIRTVQNNPWTSTPQRTDVSSQFFKNQGNVNYWDAQAKKYGFKDINDVIAFQKKNGLKRDGKVGKETIAKIEALKGNNSSTVQAQSQNSTNNSTRNNNNDDFERVAQEQRKQAQQYWLDNIYRPQIRKIEDKRFRETPMYRYMNAPTINDIANEQSNEALSRINNMIKDNQYLNDLNEYMFPEQPDYLRGIETPLKPDGRDGKHVLNITPYPNDIRYFIYQQGGTLGAQESDQDEKLMQAALFGFIGQNPDTDTQTAIATIAEAYMQDPNSLSQIIQDKNSIKKGINIMQQREPQVLEQIVKPGALKTIVNKFLKQRVKQAKMGTKLDYIKQLKNICPEGYEIEFRKAGGSVCPVCKKKHKTKKAEQGEKIEKDCGGGISKTMNSIKNAMKCGGMVKKAENGLEAKKPQKKQNIHPADTLHSGKQIYDLSGKHKQYPYLTPKRYQQLPQKDKVNADLKDEERGRKKGDER